MASLLPLLHDLLPMIMPSEPHVVRGDEPARVEERAEAPSWYQQQSSRAPGASPAGPASPPSEPDAAQLLEPIQLLDREEHHAASEALPARTRQGPSPGPPGPSPQPDGPKVFRQDAMVGVTDKMCATDAIIFAAHGCGVLLTSPTVDAVKALRADFRGEEPSREEERPRRLELRPGDFAFVPAWTEHQVVNEQQHGDVRWVIFRSGGHPVQVDLSTWGGRRLS